ncbi:G2/M phase-specific E3 ubiquitin-protein ligase-like [Ruditapes philippinarum]|uniref:G2/M phase-specific E3 ubiquitin-protein ligase-like n=1 Tax=Ruditapes philippinarum TaxID=129788 RepID=UPI00295AA3C1|nr:G2/M phase-specific E3 ubiquitin-protein ligase-like [Ruditapes philippinarum]
MGKAERKPTRKIEFGWIHDSIQVRKRFGGGTRKEDVSRNAVKEDLIEVGKRLFFPDGMSKKGAVDEFKFDILDFKETKLPENITVSECYDLFKTGVVTFYLHTTRKDSSVSAPSSTVTYQQANNSTYSNTHNQIATTSSGPVNESLPIPKDILKFAIDQSLMSAEEINYNLEFNFAGQSVSPESESQDLNMDENYTEIDTGTPTVSFRQPIVQIASNQSTDQAESIQCQADTNISQPSEDENEITLSIHEDDSVICTDDLPTMQFRGRRNLSRRRQLSQEGRPSILETVKQQLNFDGEKQPTCQEIVHAWTVNTTIDGDSVVVIHRQRIIESTKRAMNRNEFSYYKKPKIVFSGEMGEDLGGPRREYFRLLMQAVMMDVFEGSQSLTFKHSLMKLETEEYFFAGKCLAWSILHGGPGLSALNPSMYNYIVGDNISTPSVEDVTDLDARSNIDKLCRAQYISDLEEISDWMIEQGLPPITLLTDENKQQMKELALKNQVIYRVSAEAQQFKDGLSSIHGFYEVLKAFKKEMKPVMCDTKTPLNVNLLKSIYEVNFSEEGSNLRKQEDDTMYAFECFLQDCEDNVTCVQISDLLSFWTGAVEIPLLGFETKLQIGFVSDNSQQNLLPVAHTCGMILDLPRGILCPENFKTRMIKALQWGGEFHLP